jgi:hypothetical protein
VNLDSILGLFITIASGAALLFFWLRPQRKQERGTVSLRNLPALMQLRRAVGLAVEDGKRLHVSLGQSGGGAIPSAAGLVGLATLRRIAQLSTLGDRPPVATSGEPLVSLLSQDVLQTIYNQSGVGAQYRPTQARLTGITPFSYAAGALPVIRREQVYTNILVGSYGAEIALLCDASDRAGAFSLTASDTLTGQAAAFAAACQPLIGEELFALPAYIQAGPVHKASLLVQDLLRWVLIGALLLGAVFKLVQWILGGTGL